MNNIDLQFILDSQGKTINNGNGGSGGAIGYIMAAMNNDETETDISATDDRDPLEPMQKKIKLVEYLDSPSLPEEILSSSNNYTKNPEMTDTKENVRELKKDVELLKEKHRKLKLVATYKKKV